MCILLFVLKNERQQCQYKHTKNHKILEGVIYHRHHLHSNGISATPPCSGSHQTNRLRLLGCYHMARSTNQLRPMDLLLGCARNTVVCNIVSCKQNFDKKEKNYRPRSFAAQDGSFALLNYRPACSIPLNRKPK